MLLLLLFLLDIGLPAATWLNILIMAVIGLLCFLIRDLYVKLTKRIDDNSELIKDAHDKIEEEDKRLDRELRQIDAKLSDIQLNVLKSLHELKEKFSDLRK